MKINVGLIGSKLVVEKLFELSKEFSNLNITRYAFDNENETVNILQENSTKMDIVVFTGPVPYTLGKELLTEINLPCFYVTYDESTVIAMLLYLTYHKHHRLKRLSIDIPAIQNVTDVFHETNIPMDEVYVIDYEKEFDCNSLFQFHYNLWNNNKIDYALTCRINVYDKLISHGVPCFRMIPPIKSIRNTLNLVNLKSETLLLDLARFAVVNIGINMHDNKWLTYQHEELNIRLYQDLLGYAKSIGASITHKSGYISMYADRKKLEKLTSNFTDFPFLCEIKNKVDMDLSVGIGLGWTNHDAEKNALIALQEPNRGKGDFIFLVTEDKEVVGPIDAQNNYPSYILRTTDKDLLERAEKTNLSIKSLSKIKKYWDTLDQNYISSEELSNGLNISRRSAQKILKKLVEKNFAYVVGEEQPHQKGRPILLYQLRL